jgi:hypothetical protein
MRQDEIESIRIWREALRSINSVDGDGNYSEPNRVAVLIPDQTASSVHHETPLLNNRTLPDTFIQRVELPTSPRRTETVLPKIIFSLANLDEVANEVDPGFLKDSLALLLLYHIAMALHRAGILLANQRLLNQAVILYELAQSIISHPGLAWIPGMESIPAIISENKTALLGLFGVPPDE